MQKSSFREGRAFYIISYNFSPRGEKFQKSRRGERDLVCANTNYRSPTDTPVFVQTHLFTVRSEFCAARYKTRGVNMLFFNLH